MQPIKAFAGFYITIAFVFCLTAALTIYWCRSMSDGMAMPGGWTMTMAWMKMPSQTWLDAACSFLLTWFVMMVAMMLPALTPRLAAYRDRTEFLPGFISLAFAGGYFLIWMFFGALAYMAGIAITQTEMRWPFLAAVVPIIIGVVLILCGIFQLTKWKLNHLVLCCNPEACNNFSERRYRQSFMDGVRLGWNCCICCLGFMTLLLVIGVMDLRAMLIVGLMLTIERFASNQKRIARIAGGIMVGIGCLLLIQAMR